MKLLIIGDSFAADWSVKYPKVFGWPNLLSNNYQVTNLAQAGASQYRLLQQLLSVDIDQYDVFIVVHTSPYRVPTRQHPVHYHDKLHSNADLLYSDITYHAVWYKRLFNRALASAEDFFVYHFDQDYQETVYQLFVDRINQILEHKLVINVRTPLCPLQIENALEIKHMVPGVTNHMTLDDSIDLYKAIVDKINEIKRS